MAMYNHGTQESRLQGTGALKPQCTHHAPGAGYNSVSRQDSVDEKVLMEAVLKDNTHIYLET